VSAIQWTDRTLNPTVGCSRVSSGCVHCYAEVMAARIANAAQGAGWQADYPGSDHGLVTFIDRHGGDMSEWPEDLRGVREFPKDPRG